MIKNLLILLAVISLASCVNDDSKQPTKASNNSQRGADSSMYYKDTLIWDVPALMKLKIADIENKLGKCSSPVYNNIEVNDKVWEVDGYTLSFEYYTEYGNVKNAFVSYKNPVDDWRVFLPIVNLKHNNKFKIKGVANLSGNGTYTGMLIEF